MTPTVNVLYPDGSRRELWTLVAPTGRIIASILPFHDPAEVFNALEGKDPEWELCKTAELVRMPTDDEAQRWMTHNNPDYVLTELV